MSNNIAEKNYKKLSIQISLNGLSFYTLDTLSNSPSKVTTIKFSVNSDEDLIKEIQDIDVFKTDIFAFDSVTLIHNNQLFSPVPSALLTKKTWEII